MKMQPARTSLRPVLAALFACAAALPAAASDTTPPSFVTNPVLSGPPNPATPLVSRLTYRTDEPTRAELVLTTEGVTTTVVAEAGYSLLHETLVLGLRARQNHTVVLRVRDAAGNATEWPLPFHVQTKALPAAFPPLNVVASNPTRMEPGYTLASSFYSSPTLQGRGSFVWMLDAQGRVVWYHGSRDSITQVERLRNGNLLMLVANRLCYEMDLAGNIVRQWWAANLGMTGAPAGAIPVPADSFHHEFTELQAFEPGDFIALSTELRGYPNYPTSETDTTQTEALGQVAGDVVVEFREDGSLVRELKLLDVLDPYRICYGSLAGFYNPLYGVVCRDWAHANAVQVDNTDDTWVISMRHQDAVVKIRRSDHSIVWIHGPHERWNAPWSAYLLSPVGGAEWQFHQHAPFMHDGNRMTLFDNGNYRVIPPAVAPPTSTWYSRAVTYQIDPIAMTTTQVFDWRGGGTPFFSGFLGSADVMPTTGNVLNNEGSQLVTGQNKTYSRISEITTTAPIGRVFDVIVNDPSQPNPSPYNWNVYRSSRVTGVYPHL